MALVDNDRETSQLFDLLKGVGKYSSSEETEDILVKWKPPKHEIHPSVLPEEKKPPVLLEQLTDRCVKIANIYFILRSSLLGTSISTKFCI